MKRTSLQFLLPLALCATLSACDFDDVPSFVPEEGTTAYKQEMRDFVRDIASYARGINRGFIVIPFGGVELISANGRTSGSADTVYINAVDGFAENGVFYGYDSIDQPTPSADRQRLQAYLNLAKDNGAAILVTDFAFTQSKVDDAYQDNLDAGYISFTADNEALDNIPDYPADPFNVNRNDIEELADARNFLNLINPRNYSTRQELVDAVSDTDYDLILLDFFFNGEEYTSEQIRQLKRKPDGGMRLLIAYLNIGVAQDNRFYWQNHWVSNPPDWLGERVPDTIGDYYVDYWRQGWQDIIYGNEDSYIFRIASSEFDGAYMDGIGVFAFFEETE